MKKIQMYLLKQFIPVFFVSLLFFILVLELVDLFSSLWRYLANEVVLADMFRVLFLYIPKCVSYSVPVAVLFAASYTIGNMYAHNELTAVFSAGYPLFALALPLLFFGVLLSVAMFFFEDRVVIHSLMKKNELNRLLTRSDLSLSNANVVVMDDSGNTVYTAEYYRDTDQILYDVFIVMRNTDGSLDAVVQSFSGSWNGNSWKFENPEIYKFDGKGGLIPGNIEDFVFDEPPDLFRRNVTSVDELPVAEAGKHIEMLRRSGFPYAEDLANYYKRFSFPFTVFIVLFFSVSLAGRFKKNILLMSLLLSLAVAVSYYILQMVTMLLAKWEYVSPLFGAWFPVVVFIGSGIGILKTART